jgi:broad specificity phosphatase PhoE
MLPLLPSRHGHSTANAQDLIVASLEHGIDPKWGLSDLGKQQAAATGVTLLALLTQSGESDALAHVLVCTSPFSRCLQTAAAVAAPLGITPTSDRFVQLLSLRERYFGSHELTSTDNYAVVWAEDAASIHSAPPGGGESVLEVSTRLMHAIDALEEEHAGCIIVLVSHGDSLSILAAALVDGDLAGHRRHGLPNCGILRIPAL